METMETFYLEHSTKAFAVAFKILKRREAAQDIMQDTMLKAWALRHQCESEKYGSWVATISANAAKQYMKAKDTSWQVGTEYIEWQHFSDSFTEGAAVVEEKICRLKALSPPIPQILNLYYFEGCSYDAISNLLQIGKPDVWTAIYKIDRILSE